MFVWENRACVEMYLMKFTSDYYLFGYLFILVSVLYTEDMC